MDRIEVWLGHVKAQSQYSLFALLLNPTPISISHIPLKGQFRATTAVQRHEPKEAYT